MTDRDSLRKSLYKNYDHESNSGLFGIFLSRGHKALERTLPSIPSPKDLKILEIGGARNPHYKWIKNLKSVSEYHIEDLDALNSNENFEIFSHEPSQLIFNPSYFNYFDRIIACHLLEHVQDPFTVLEQWLKMLKDGGIISLLLPNDPGLLWGMGRYIYKRKLRRNGWSDIRDYDLAVSLEHVNSIQNLLRISKYLGKRHRVKIFWWPFRIGITELNLQTLIHIIKSPDEI